MNRSGEAVAALLDSMREEPPPENLLVVTDDVHLSVGRMRFRRRGGSGGHNGLASVEAALGGPGYPRLRLGVGAAAGPALIDHVLGPFSPAEEAILAETIPVAAEAVGAWWARGLEACQNRYNGWVAPGAARAERDDQTEPPAADS
jgi:PTH1 family peptidyl-tRNA hydrolase